LLFRAVVLALQSLSLVVSLQLLCASMTADANLLAAPPKKTLSRGNLELDIRHGLPATANSTVPLRLDGTLRTALKV
jgi:hypothetical protein